MNEMRKNIFLILLIILPLFACSTQQNKDRKPQKLMKQAEENTYSEDKSFLEKYCDLIELSSGNAKVLLSKDYQGRVFTSTATGANGLSFGWINYDLFKSGKVSKQFNPYGGEERLWLGPEGGPFSIYFEKGKEQMFENWVVPQELDVLAFDIVRKTPQSVSFQKEFTLKNYTGTNLNIGIERSVKLLESKEVESILNCSIDKSLEYVAYESENILINKGVTEWNEQTEVLSIWMLSMFTPSTVGVVFIPFKKESAESKLSGIVTDDYFGKVPSDRLLIKDGIIYFKTDGKYRSKIGVSPEFTLPYCGSYDSQKQVLTLLWFSLPNQQSKYVNSKWGNQDPFKGDAVNSYNDGPVEDGSIMGPFYEIESSSPATSLSPGQKIIHTQRIFHITGDENKISLITEKLFNLTIIQIKEAFTKN